MSDIQTYMETAKERLGTKSDRQLALALGLNPVSIHQWRREISFPSDQTMVRLAEIVGDDPREALLKLAIWRAKDDTTREVHKSILKDWKRSLRNTAAVGVGTAIALSLYAYHDAKVSAQVERDRSDLIYIM